MDPLLLQTATAFGLAGAAGLNTTLPLLIVGLLARLGLIQLGAPFDALAGDVTLAGLTLLAAIEILGDKIPGVDSVVQTLQWPLAAAAGAILFASQNSVVTWVSPELAILVGLLTAGGVHAVRTAVRPAFTTFTLGVGNPIVSFAEDALAATLALYALFAPLVAVLLVVVVGVVLILLAAIGARRGIAFGRSLIRPT
jgi:hypothetical protein